MTYLLVLQWPAATAADFEALVEMEHDLESGIAAGVVDGHDFGSGEMNIFIESKRPEEAFAEAARILSNRPAWREVRAAFRETRGETFTVLWPAGLADFHVT